MSKNKQQRGFSAISIIIIVLVIAALAATGWYILDKNKKEDSASNVNNSNSQAQNDYLVIKEWGVRVRLNNSVHDAMYTELGSGSVGLTTASLRSIKGCEEGFPVTYVRAKKGDPIGTIVADDRGVPPMIKIEDYYYLNTGSGNSCANFQDQKGSEKAANVREGLNEAFKTLEKIPSN